MNWITGATETGSGDGTVTYNVASYTGTSTRTGHITVAGQTYTVTQTGVSCSYSLSPTSKSFTSSGGSGSFSVSAPSGCNWSASADQNWITGANESDSGNGTVIYNVTSNPGTSSRTGHVTVGGQTHTVNQAPGGPPGNEHPADSAPYCGCDGTSCADNRIKLCEAIGYATAWKRGDHDDTDYAIRGLFLWQAGECYTWEDSSDNWIEDTCN